MRIMNVDKKEGPGQIPDGLHRNLKSVEDSKHSKKLNAVYPPKKTGSSHLSTLDDHV